MAEECSKKGAQYILSFDGKMVARGLKGECFGDIDLWGVEKPISMKCSLQLIQRNIRACEYINSDVNQNKLFAQAYRLESVMNEMSRRVRTLRQRIEGEHYLRLKLVRMSQNQTLDSRQQYSYKMQLSFLNEHSARCDSHIGRALHLNMRILSTLAMLRENSDVFTKSKVVSLHLQNNAHFLFDAERNSQFFDLDLPENFDLIKQRSPQWHALRQKAKVTGSTMYKALGLESLVALKQHHYEFVKKRKPPDFSPEIKLRLQYGQENEKHAVATLLGGFLPAFRPSCYSYLEVGPVMLTVYGEQNFIEVSADGVIRCVRGEDCPQKQKWPYHEVIPIEVKTVYPDHTKPLQPHYRIPPRYVPQCLAEMYAYKCKKLWLISYTENSAALITVLFDTILWEKMLTIAHELHGGEKPKVPVKLHTETKQLREMISKYTESNCTFVCEIPSFRGLEGTLRESEILSPLSYCDVRDKCNIQMEEINRQCKAICFEGKPLFQSVHNTLRQEAQEVLVFMLSDHNRQHDEYVPYSMPLGYAMKGKTLKNNELRFLIDHCRDELKEKKIPILCEVYDGQWQNVCMTSTQGEPLNKLRLIKPTWQRIQKLSKEKCIQELTLASKLKTVDIEKLEKLSILPNGLCELYNIRIQRELNGSFIISSRGGSNFGNAVMGKIRSVTNVTHPELWEKTDNNTHLLRNDDPARPRKKQTVGLRESERNLVHLLDTEIVTALETELGDDFLDEESTSQSNNEERNSAEVLLSLALNHEDITLLRDILEDLREFNEKKWDNCSPEDFYPKILTDPNVLNKSCTVPELAVISRVIEHKTGRKFYMSSAPKAVNVNLLTQAFGGDTFLHIPTRSVNKKTKVKTLQHLAKDVLLDDTYKVEQLQVALANVVHTEKREHWLHNCPIHLSAYIPHVWEDHLEFEMFSYPEFSLKRQQVEHRTLDYTHILTNMKTHILSKGYDFCKKEHFQELATENPNLLSRPLVFDNIDQQNAYSAILMFSVPVENFLRKKGHIESAEFVCLVREWHTACNERGIRADTRVSMLYNMYRFLTKDIDFDRFPFPLTGRYWRGMPIQTYEAILQNVCTRIQLYRLAHNESYNSRAVSTLCNESFFSDMVRLDKESRAYPKACNVPKIFGRVVTLNYYKHKPEKSWYLTATHKGTYPEHLAEYTCKLLLEQDGFYVNHFFDFQDEHESQRCRRCDISRGSQPLRFAGGVRKFYRGDESKILAEERAGLAAKPLPRYDAESDTISYN